MKILIIKSSSMGDVVHALPVAFDIAQHCLQLSGPCYFAGYFQSLMEIGGKHPMIFV